MATVASIVINRELNAVSLQFVEIGSKPQPIITNIRLKVSEAYQLWIDLGQELDRTNPLLADDEK